MPGEAAVIRGAGLRRRLMATLFVAQVCSSTGQAIGMAVGGIIAAEITGTNLWSGLPVAISGLGTALASWPLAALMARAGRRPGLALGYALAVVGTLLAIGGASAGSFLVMLLGMTLFGIAHTSNLLARYAAADITPSAARGRAMGLIVWGSTGGSILGPNLMGPAVGIGTQLGLTPTVGAFLVSVAGYALASLLVQVFLRPDPLVVARQIEERVAAATPVARATPIRSLPTILRDPRVRIALGTLMTSQLVMIGTTSTSPVYLHDHGHAVHTVGLAVSLHLAGMYVASPLSGWLSDRLGRMPVIVAGGLVLIAAVAVAGLAPSQQSGLVMLGLFLNGIGWNLAFVSGSALLTDLLRPAERASLQGLADLVMGLSGALGSAAGGMVLGAWGFATLNALGAAAVLAPLIAVWLAYPTVGWTMRRML